MSAGSATTTLREVQWRHFWDHQNWTPVHLYDPTSPEVNGGTRKTLCGKVFGLEDARIRGRDGDSDSLHRGCKSCKRIAEKRRQP